MGSSEAGDDVTEDDVMMQVDGAGDEEDSESLSQEPGDDDSEFSAEGRSVDKSKICPLCKEEMKFSKTYHFAMTHFRPRLQRDLPTTKPFICPDCGETQLHKINLWSHYLGRAHKHLDQWLEEYQTAEVKPDWCDPNPVNPKSSRRSITVKSGPSSPAVDRSSPLVSKEWFCDLCHGLVPQRREIHFASLHFKEKLKTMLPTQAPFVCPDVSCGAEHKHFLNLSTHFLTQHGYLKLWLEEKGISYEVTTKKQKPDRLLSSQPPATLAEVSQDAALVTTNVFGKHLLSSSESEDDTTEDDNRDMMLDQPVHTSLLESSLTFLKQIKTEPETSSASVKKKRVKRQLDYDLVDVVETLKDNNDNDQYQHSREPPAKKKMTPSVMPED